MVSAIPTRLKNVLFLPRGLRVAACVTVSGERRHAKGDEFEHDPSCVGMSMCVNRNYDTTWMIDERTRPATSISLRLPDRTSTAHSYCLGSVFRCPEVPRFTTARIVLELEKEVSQRC